MKVSFYTLGCRVNQYETEMLKERFRKAGFEVTGEEECADVYVINTCTVTSLADRKSRQFIRRMKRLNPEAFICVTGCYAQVSSKEVAAVEGVNLVVGTSDKGLIPELISERLNKDMLLGEIAVSEHAPGEKYCETGIVASMEGRTRAYIKVQEGCNRYCSYCLIPYARGDVRSRAPMDIFAEAKMLISQGFKEVVLTGINTALYGTEKGFAPDFGPEMDKYRALWRDSCDEAGNCKYGTGLGLLLAMLNDIDADFRIRIGSLEPTVIDIDDVLGLLKYDKLCHHLHLSIQSGSNAVLRSMNRHYTREDYLAIARALYDFDPHYGISTDIIAGFPGETESDFRQSIDIENEISFCKVHAFNYSKRPGTAGAAMNGHLPPEVKTRRTKELIHYGTVSQENFFNSCSTDVRRVLVEEYLPELDMYAGYTDNYIRTYFKVTASDPEKIINTFLDVKLDKPFRDGMSGHVLDSKSE